MNSRNIHDLIPFPKLFKLLFGIAAVVQLIVITTTHITGYSVLNDTLHFVTRYIFGTVLSLAAIFIVAYPDLFLIRYLNRSFPWESKTFVRSVIEFFMSVLLGVIMAVLLTLFSHYINPYEEGLFRNLIYNASIFAICNVILMLILEGWIFFIEGSHSRKKSEELEDQLSQLKFEILKSQIDSHFMFNSLNVLSGLIDTDREKAQQFINEFSRIYRYVMESIEKPVVTVKKELQFARSYMFLQQMRYGEYLYFEVDLATDILDALIPPLSLQVVLENVCKHNLVSKEQPLRIEISGNSSELVITNNLQPKISSASSNGTGQQNLVKRYALLGNDTPDFRVGTSNYTVTLPLIYEEY
jgi:hypothetical protein